MTAGHMKPTSLSPENTRVEHDGANSMQCMTYREAHAAWMPSRAPRSALLWNLLTELIVYLALLRICQGLVCSCHLQGHAGELGMHESYQMGQLPVCTSCRAPCCSCMMAWLIYSPLQIGLWPPPCCLHFDLGAISCRSHAWCQQLAVDRSQPSSAAVAHMACFL